MVGTRRPNDATMLVEARSEASCASVKVSASPPLASAGATVQGTSTLNTATSCRVLYGEQARFFPDEIRPHLKHMARGMVGMAAGGKDMNASQFYITTGEELDSLDEKHTLFGEARPSRP